MKSHDLENKLRSQLLEVSKWSVIATDFCRGGFYLLGDMLMRKKSSYGVCVCVFYFSAEMLIVGFKIGIMGESESKVGVKL